MNSQWMNTNLLHDATFYVMYAAIAIALFVIVELIYPHGNVRRLLAKHV